MAHPIENTLALLRDAMSAHRQALNSGPAPQAAPELAFPLDKKAQLVRQLLTGVEKQAGIEVSRSTADRLARALRPVPLTECAAWVSELETLPAGDPGWLTLIEGLTVHETYVMRDAPQLAFFAAQLPALIEEAEALGTFCLRFWSAGCATGEEAYTIAALALDALVEKNYAVIEGPDTILRPPWRIEVLGSDISRPALARAQTGLYETGPLSSFRAESTNLLRHFPPSGGAGPSGPAMRMPSPALKAAVRFEHFNIAGDPLPDRPFDAVFCRNVLVYFSARSRRRALDRLGGKVRKGGYLILGPTDTLTGMEAFETVWAPSAVIYRRRNESDRGLR